MHKQYDQNNLNAEIITADTELLLGDILNTDAQFLSSEFAELGISFYQTVVGIINYLKKHKYKLACAESCTGGLLTAAFVAIPGVSEILLEGSVTYSNESKINRLGVSEQTLKEFGAVSHQTACEMALGAAKTSNANIAISTTGIAGPDGGTKEKPVGLVYIGLFVNGKLYSKELHLSGSRQKIRERSVSEALCFLLNHICPRS